MSSIREVALHARVSTMTVSRTLNHPEMVSPSTREQVLQAIRELGYVPNAMARSLTRGKTDVVALLLADIQNPFFTTLARGAEDEGEAEGYRLMLCNTDEREERERQYLEVLLSRQVDGVILASAGVAHVRRLVERGIPVVLVDRVLPGVEVDSVMIDVYQGGTLLARHLLEQGYRDIAFIGGSMEISTIEARVSGCRDALQAAGLPLRVHSGHLDRESGEQLVAHLCDEKHLPEALIAANNMVAVGAMVELRRRGIRVPDDMGLASIGELDLASLLDPFLTVILEPSYDVGRMAMKLLSERLAGYAGAPRHFLLPVELVPRRSTQGAHPKA